MKHNLIDEDKLEQLYWNFLDEKNLKNRSERDIFKGKVRWFVHQSCHSKDKEID